MSKDKTKTTITQYSPKTIEPKWQAKWLSEKTYQPQLDSANPKTRHDAKLKSENDTNDKTPLKQPQPGTPFYNLMMFPYPSAEGLHVGGIYTFGGIDVYGRFKRMNGYE